MESNRSMRMAMVLVAGLLLTAVLSGPSGAQSVFTVVLPMVTGSAGWVEPGNEAPVARDDTYQTPGDTTLAVSAALGVLANDSDPDADPLTAVLVDSVAHGVLNLNPDGSFDYTPNAGFSGQDRFTYRADDGVLTSAPATVTLNVDQGNVAPVANPDAYSVAEDQTLIVAAAGVLANDTDDSQSSLSAVLGDDVDHGVLVLNSDGSFHYTPAANYFGQDSFTYQASNGVTLSAAATVTITITAVNDAPVMESGEIGFSMQVVGKSVRATHEVVAGDFDRDGDLDVAASDYDNGKVMWYQNTDGKFASFELDADLQGAYPVGVGDVDGDGYDDVLAAGYLADTYVWYRSDGAGAFTRRVVDDAADGAHSIVTADIDGDGDTDLVTASQDANVVAWYENDGDENFTQRVVDDAADGAKRATPVDLDLDGDMDILVASYFTDEIAWHENNGAQNFTKHIIDTNADGAYFVSAADADGDGDVDVFAANSLDGTITFYRHDGAGGFSKAIVDGDAPGARTVIAVDMDRDGDVDLVGTSFTEHTIAWYQNDGTGNFTYQPIDEDSRGAYGVFAIDIDFDGDMDVLSASKRASRVALYRQTHTHEIAVAQQGTRVIDQTVLQAADVDDAAAGLVYTLTTAPKRGEVRRGGVALAAGDTFTQGEVAGGQVVYVHTANDGADDAFTYQLADGGEDDARPVDGVVTVVVKGA